MTMFYVIYITNLGMIYGIKWGFSDHQQVPWGDPRDTLGVMHHQPLFQGNASSWLFTLEYCKSEQKSIVYVIK